MCVVEVESWIVGGSGDRKGMVVDRILGDVLGDDVVESGLGGALEGRKIVGWVVLEGAGVGEHL